MAVNVPVNTPEVGESLAPIPLSWEIDVAKANLSPSAVELIEQERTIPVAVCRDLSLRAKIIDACGLTCNFCHNEGTPVAIDNRSGLSVLGETGKSGRISVFSATNGVDFVPGRMEPDDEQFSRSLSILRNRMGYNELHLTGGEPGIHPRLSQIIQVSREAGYKVRMTSNGERGAEAARACEEGGLEKVNFSIFGTTPDELATVQDSKYQDANLARKKIDALHEAITASADAGIEVGANIVMSDSSHTDRVRRLLDTFDPRLDIRILPDLSRGTDSVVAIYEFLSRLGAKPLHMSVEAGSSNMRVKYGLPDKRLLHFKQIRPVRIPACGGCEFNNPNDCHEGYYGTRLYASKLGEYMAGVCIQRMDLVESVDDFANGGLSEQIVNMREAEYSQMAEMFKV